MRYSLYVNQVKSLEWKLTLSEAIILDYIVRTLAWKSTFYIDGKLYYWISRTKVIQDMPIITEKPDTIYNIFKSLHKKGLIVYLKQNAKDLIHITKKSAGWEFDKNSDLNPNEIDNSDLNPKKLGLESEKDAKNSDLNPTYYNTSLLEGEGLESSPSEKFPFSNSENSGDSYSSKEEAEIPKRGGGFSVEEVASKIENLLRSKMKPELSEILAKSDLDFPTLTRMFTDYWIYDKGRQFDSKNWKGMAESFRQWTTVAGKKEIPKKEVTSGIKSNDQMEKIIEYVERTKRDLKMTKDESASITKFMAENDVSDTILWDSTKSFVTGSGNTWTIWLRIVQREHRERFMTN